MSLHRPNSFLETASGAYICLLRCPRVLGRNLSQREAERHEESFEHVMRIRAISEDAHVPASSSPPRPADYALSSEPDYKDEPIGLTSEHIPSISVPGPQIEGDHPTQIYNDWDQAWGPHFETRPESEHSDLEDNEQLNFGRYEPHHQWNYTPQDKDDEAVTSVASDTESLQSPSSELDDEAPEDDVFACEGDEGQSIAEVIECDVGSDEELVEDHSSDNDDGSALEDWWPWSNKKALLDVMSAFPRSVFSEAELEVTRWFASKCGVASLPTIRQVKSHRPKVHAHCTANPTLKKGKLGNLYSILDLGRILADEFANPLVRPFIKVLSEESGERLSDASQAGKWRHEVCADLAGPMVRQGHKDFFVNEPAVASIGDNLYAVLPNRWYLKEGKIWAHVQYLTSHPSDDSLVLDNRVDGEDIPLEGFQASFPDLQLNQLATSLLTRSHFYIPAFSP